MQHNQTKSERIHRKILDIEDQIQAIRARRVPRDAQDRPLVSNGPALADDQAIELQQVRIAILRKALRTPVAGLRARLAQLEAAMTEEYRMTGQLADEADFSRQVEIDLIAIALGEV